MQLEQEKLQHSAAHVLATAALRVFPNVKIGVGKVVDDSFYYDFEFPEPIQWKHVVEIEQEINLIIQQDLPIGQLTVPRDQAFNVLMNRLQVYTAELLQNTPSSEDVSFYRVGEEFYDLCRGPHLHSTGEIGAIMLSDLSTVYWKDDESRPRMQRITGRAFADLESFHEYREQEEEQEKRNYVHIGQNLQLHVAKRQKVIFTPYGSKLMHTLEKKISDMHTRFESNEIIIPHDNHIEAIRQHHSQYFQHKNRSYKELPLRTRSSQTIHVRKPQEIYRHKLYDIRTMAYSSFFSEQEYYTEINAFIAGTIDVIDTFRAQISVTIHTPSVSTDHNTRIIDILHKKGVSQINVAQTEEGSEHIQFLVTDSLDRRWGICTISISEGPIYAAKTGDLVPTRHAVSLWNIHKLYMYLLEDTNGTLPFSLAPLQVIILPVQDTHEAYADQIVDVITAQGYTAETYDKKATMQAKVRHAELRQIPVIVIVGDKEKESGTVSVRLRDGQELGLLSVNDLLQQLHNQR